MKRKTRFSNAGSTGGRFEEDVYERARRYADEQAQVTDETGAVNPTLRRNLETGDLYSTEPITRAAETPRATPAAEPAYRRSTGATRGPDFIISPEEEARQRRLMTPGVDAVESIYPEKYLLGGGAGAGLKAMHSAAKALAPYSGRQLATAAKEGLETAVKEGAKKGSEVAAATARGMKSRADIQAKRAEAAKAAERGAKSRKDIQAKRKARETEAVDKYQNASEYGYAKGGMTASRRADGIAQRGKTRGTIVMCKGGYKK